MPEGAESIGQSVAHFFEASRMLVLDDADGETGHRLVTALKQDHKPGGGNDGDTNDEEYHHALAPSASPASTKNSSNASPGPPAASPCRAN